MLRHPPGDRRVGKDYRKNEAPESRGGSDDLYSLGCRWQSTQSPSLLRPGRPEASPDSSVVPECASVGFDWVQENHRPTKFRPNPFRGRSFNDSPRWFETRYGTVGIFICADMRSPDISRLLVAKGAKVLFQPTNYFHTGRYARQKQICRKTHVAAKSSDGQWRPPGGGKRRPRGVSSTTAAIIAPYGQGPEPQLARATRKEQLLVAEIEFDENRNPVADQAKSTPLVVQGDG